jgi:large subunit ribosomal protein L17e
MSSPCHIEIILSEKDEVVARANKEEEPVKKKVSKKKLNRQKMMQRGE